MARTFIHTWMSEDLRHTDIAQQWRCLQAYIISRVSSQLYAVDFLWPVPGFDTVDVYRFSDGSRLFVGMAFDKWIIVSETLGHLWRAGSPGVEVDDADILISLWNDENAMSIVRMLSKPRSKDDFQTFKYLAWAMGSENEDELPSISPYRIVSRTLLDGTSVTATCVKGMNGLMITKEGCP